MNPQMNPQANPQDPSQFDLRAAPVPAPMSVPTPAAATDPKSQLLERLTGAVNVLVTVSANPTVDQLAAAIGFTLVLNKLKKHGTAVFSGEVPSTIEFLQPEKTLEKDTNSLRDFIVALDKSKADKLRYKVEDKFVKIFITPYHTSLSETDLEFGQGDFNVDVIIALGVNRKEDLDQAISAHGRILHDATVVSITKVPGEDMGAINWHVPEASSFCEILVDVSDQLKSPQTELFDQQIATAFLTGIVAETDRFSNDKTTPQTMNMSAILMKAGANQQLIATKLDPPVPVSAPIPEFTPTALPPQPTVDSMADMPMPAAMPPVAPVSNDGSLAIVHPAEESLVALIDLPAEEAKPAEPEAVDNIHIDDEGTLHKFGAAPTPQPSMDVPLAEPGTPLPEATPLTSSSTVDHDDQTLEEIERAVNSPHLSETPATDSLPPLEPGLTTPPADLNAMPVDLDMGHGDNSATPQTNTPPTVPPPMS
jgi:hypothetical protein